MSRSLRMPVMKMLPGMILWLTALIALAPWPAFSQTSPELLAESFACERVREVAIRKDSTCDESGFLCEPSASDCESFCTTVAQSCSRFGRSTLRSLSLLVRSEYRELIRLCEGESDSTLCRTVLRSAKRRLRNEARQVSADLQESCGSEEFSDACNQTCRDLSAPLLDCSLAALEASATTEGVEAAYNPGAGIQGVFSPSDIRPPMTGATAN